MLVIDPVNSGSMSLRFVIAFDLGLFFVDTMKFDGLASANYTFVLAGLPPVVSIMVVVISGNSG